MNNPLALIVKTETKRKEQANKCHQKIAKDKHQIFPKEHYRSFAITTDMEEDRNAESRENARCWLCHESYKVSDCLTKKYSSARKTQNSKTQRAVLQLSIEYPSN